MNSASASKSPGRVTTVSYFKIIPFLSSGVAFVAAILLANYQIASVQQNGLPQYIFPYGQYSFYVQMVATGLLVFGFTFNLAVMGHGNITAKWLRIIAGSLGFAVGSTLSGFSWLILWIEQSDYAVRCGTGSCAATLIESYGIDVELLSIAILAGSILAAVGLWQVIRSRSRRKNLLPNGPIISQEY